MSVCTLFVATVLYVTASSVPAWASGDPVAASDLDLTALGLEELMDIEITVASRTKQRLSEVPPPCT